MATKGAHVFYLKLDNGREIATAERAVTLVDAGVLLAVRDGKGSRVIERWHADGRHGYTGTIEKIRYWVDEEGAVFRIDGSGVPATVAGTAELWLDGARKFSTKEGS